MVHIRRDRAFALHAGDRGSITGWDRPKLLKQVVTVPLTNPPQQVSVTRLRRWPLKELARVTVGVAR